MNCAQELAKSCLSLAKQANLNEFRNLQRKDLIEFIDVLEKFLMFAYD